MLTTLDTHGIFWSSFAYLYTITLSGHWFAKRGQGLPKNSTAANQFWNSPNRYRVFKYILANTLNHACTACVESLNSIARPASVHYNRCVSRSVRPCANAHNSWNTWYILFKLKYASFCRKWPISFPHWLIYISNDQELMQSEPKSRPQNQSGK